VDWYNVQYLTESGEYKEWVQAESWLDAAAESLIDNGFDCLYFPDGFVTVVRRVDYSATHYSIPMVEQWANHILGLETPTGIGSDVWIMS
jgi:hypothetical protein